MGFVDFINGFFGSLRDLASSSTEFKCCNCIKCKNCIKTLSNGEQVRVYTCSGIDDTISDDAYIDSLLPSIENGFTTDYIEAYNKNRDAIYNYLYSNPVIYQNTAKPLSFDSCIPVTSYGELLHFYKAMECPHFRPFIDTSNILGYNDILHTAPAPDIISFENLSPEDKMIVTQRNDW